MPISVPRGSKESAQPRVSSHDRTDEFVHRVEQHLLSVGKRLTKTRRTICTLIGRMPGLFDYNDLKEHAQRSSHPSTHATVYRIIADLVESGLLVELPRYGTHRSYIVADPECGPLTYIVCKRCHRIEILGPGCVTLPTPSKVGEAGYQTSPLQIRLEAICSNGCPS